MVYDVEDLEQTIIKVLREERKTPQTGEGREKIIKEIKNFINSITQ